MFSIMSDLSNVNAQVANFKSANCTCAQFALLKLRQSVDGNKREERLWHNSGDKIFNKFADAWI